MVPTKTSKPKASEADVEKRAKALLEHQEQVDRGVKCARSYRRYNFATLGFIISTLPVSITMLVLSLRHSQGVISLWLVYTVLIFAATYCGYRLEMNFKDMRHWWDQATITTLINVAVISSKDVKDMIESEHKIVEAFRGKA